MNHVIMWLAYFYLLTDILSYAFEIDKIIRQYNEYTHIKLKSSIFAMKLPFFTNMLMKNDLSIFKKDEMWSKPLKKN